MDRPFMTPAPGERLVRFVGDTIRFHLRTSAPAPEGYRALLRTDLGRASTLRSEVISSYAGRRPISVSVWRDIPLDPDPAGGWSIELPLTEVGFSHAKAYLVDPRGRQVWPDGPDVGISVHPDRYRSANTIYCAFTRLFGASRHAISHREQRENGAIERLERDGYSVIPPSGKFRDLIRQLPHIFDKLGCRILHLLPVNPAPTTLARFGPFGSPYAVLDLTAIDPALVEFDKRTTGIDQFRELTTAVHELGGRVILDVVINHTGWGSQLYERHPEWFVRQPDGTFVSPGAWGVTWEDLVELEPHHVDLWEHFANAFLTWCRRGVDGFRCDAGYKVPLPVWQYIGARVREEYPETLFLLEGLGGAVETTELLLSDGGMQWAYSELFQNYSGTEVAHYLDYAHRQSERVGLYVHYSETHDNDRLAKRGRAWSLLRNLLCGLTSAGGAYGFTCGVEWLANEKIDVHASTGIAWDNPDNLVPELSRLNQLLLEHPCFFDGAKLTRLSAVHSPVYALRRQSAEGLDHVLVLVNTDPHHAQTISLEEDLLQNCAELNHELLSQSLPERKSSPPGTTGWILPAGAAYCLSATAAPKGLCGEDYRKARAQAAWAMHALTQIFKPEEIGPAPWRELAARVDRDSKRFLASLTHLDRLKLKHNLLQALDQAPDSFPQVVTWRVEDARRVTPLPPQHWLLIEDSVPFRASFQVEDGSPPQNVESISTREGYVAFFPPTTHPSSADAELLIERYRAAQSKVEARVRLLRSASAVPARVSTGFESLLVLLTNGIGGMARIPVDLGRVTSKYDCLLGANLHPEFPVDRHVFAKRIRVWINADGFISPLDAHNLISVEPGPPACWRFIADSGDRRTVEIELRADMIEQHNTTVLHFSRPLESLPSELAESFDVRLTLRVDIEDRNFHSQTQRNPGADHHFSVHSRPLSDKPGFAFTPAADRALRVFSTGGLYHHEAEWCHGLPHPVEQTRGHVGSGDAYSPGWFELPLKKGESVALVLSADASDPSPEMLRQMEAERHAGNSHAMARSAVDIHDSFGKQLAVALRAFVVRRGLGKTVIAGYPWFLDWGRDTFICARGLLAAGCIDEVTDLLLTYGRFVENGTMPNTIHGEDASNRDTSDAALWYAVVCAETALRAQKDLFALTVDSQGRTISDVLRDVAVGYCRGTPNGIRMDPLSGLIWSPSHFTWMDTNHPAGTPREGYPVEIQVLWIQLLRLLERLEIPPENEPWGELAQRAEKNFHTFFWFEDAGYLADCLFAKDQQPARSAVPDNALRSNYLFAVTFKLVTGERARRCVEAALRHLIVPGALRTLAPLPVSPPLPIHGHDGRLLNNPTHPYCGRYQGDEDTRRKPAYHNGTAWTWTFPVFCEALAQAWDFSPESVAAAKAYLGSMDRLLVQGCLGQIPEILDGDAPHLQRGCDAQAWGATEAFRVWRLLN
jgi:starch synthase (maltosyl-transferring)